MPRSLRSPHQQSLRRLLTDARKGAGLTQADLAARLKRPQSFVAKYEVGERSLYLADFVEVARALDHDPVELLRNLLVEWDAFPSD